MGPLSSGSMRQMKIIHTVLGAAVALMVTVLMSQFAYAGPNGNWFRPKTGATIKVFNCGGGLGMKVIKSKTAGKVGRSGQSSRCKRP